MGPAGNFGLNLESRKEHSRTMPSTEERLLTVALNAWKQNVERAEKIFSGRSAADLEKEVAPGKNRLIYLWGHLTAVHDAMLPLLGLGPRLHPELDVPFITKPDKSVPDLPSADAVKKAWEEVNGKLASEFAKLSPADWLQKHSAVSDEDFAKDPLRNRFAVLLSRTSHLAFHLGQTALLPK
jgi:DinB superfamily